MNGKKTIWTRRFASLFLIEVCLDFGMLITRPIISNYAIALGAAIATAGFIAGSNMVMAFLMRPVSGYLADRIDKRKILIASCCAFLISAIGNALSNSLELITVFCAMQGIALSFKSISVFSMAALSVPSERIGSGIGWIGLVITAATAVGPGIGAHIGAAYGFRSCFVMSSALMLAGLMLAVRFKPPENAEGHILKLEVQHDATFRQTITSIAKAAFFLPVLPLAAIGGIVMLTPNAMSGLVLTITEMGSLEGGPLYFVAYAAVAVVARPLAGRITDSRNLLFVALPGLLIAAGGMTLLSLRHDQIAVIVCGICMGLGQASTQSALQAEAMRGVDPTKLGRATNTYYLGVDLGGALGPTLGGLVLQTLGCDAMFLVCAGSLVFACALLVTLITKRKKTGEMNV